MNDDDDLDEQFPPGDGTADTTGTVTCPYCGAVNEVALDPGSGTSQEYVEDCQICCRPWLVSVRFGPDGQAEISVEPADA